MLLRHTTSEITERQALTVNPAKTCQPIGAMYAAFGLRKCMPHSHGSQGCCAYHRSTLSRHYKEPVVATTSSFTEGSSVFGGQSNLLQAINNIFSIYEPDVIACHSTCLSETIGDDMPQIIDKAREDGLIPEGKCVIHANTPSYVGSHITGFSAMTKAFVDYFAEPSEEKTQTVNVIPGWMEPADYRELKRLSNLLGVQTIMFPDTSGVLDQPQTGKHVLYPEGGVSREAMRFTGSSVGTIALGHTASEAAARALKSKCEVPYSVQPLPIGLRGTDRYIMALKKLTGCEIPVEVEYERGRLVDMITDMDQYFYNKKVALWGDPDQLVSLTEFLVDIGMKPRYIVTGTPGKKFLRRIGDVVGEMAHECEVRQGAQADMFLMHQWIKKDPVDLLIGNTYGKYISRDDNIPFVRHGFPILDRVGHQYFPTAGYRGAMRLLEQILDALLGQKDRDCDEPSFELTM